MTEIEFEGDIDRVAGSEAPPQRESTRQTKEEEKYVEQRNLENTAFQNLKKKFQEEENSLTYMNHICLSTGVQK